MRIDELEVDALAKAPRNSTAPINRIPPQDDERRLFQGSRGQFDPKAVPVIKPSPIPGGFRPQNNLTRSTGLEAIAPHNGSMGQVLSIGGKRDALEMETTRGDNIDDESPTDKSRSKRPKVGPHSSSQNSLEIDTAALDFDPRHQNYTFKVTERSQGRDRETKTPRPSNYSQNSRTNGTSELKSRVPEYEGVEKMMDSSSRRAFGKDRFNMRSNNLQRDNASTDTERLQSSFLLDSDRIQTPSEQRVRPITRRYQGTAKTKPIIITDGPNDLPESGEHSRYFAHSRQTQQPINYGERQVSPVSKKQQESKKHDGSPGLQSSPIEDNLSSDELAAPDTMGCTRNPSPQKSSCADVPVKLPPSNIPASGFTTSRNKPLNKRNLYNQTTKHGEKDFWGIGLTSAHTNGEYISSNTLGLVFDEGNQTFNVYNSGPSLTHPGFQVQVRKVRRVIWHSFLVRFQSSASGALDNVLDIQLSKAKEMSPLIKKLLENIPPSKVAMCESCEKLERMFNHKLSEQKKRKTIDIEDTTEESQGVQPFSKDRKRRETSGLVDYPHKLSNVKRRREPDKLANRRRLKDGLEAPSSQSTSPDVFGRRSTEDLISCEPNRHGKASLQNANLNPNSNLGLELDSEPRDVKKQRSLKEHQSPDSKFSNEGLASAWHNRPLFPKNNIPAEWRDLLESRDLERLEDGEYLNDNLIEFYLKYLKNQLEQTSAEMAEKVYFFNTFFFASLTRKEKRGININYEAVQKWTRSIDIFSYDYVVVPICESQHWYVAIICNLPALSRDPGLEEAVPADGPSHSPKAYSIPDEPGSSSIESRDPKPIQVTNLSTEDKVPFLEGTENPSDQSPSKSFADLSLEPGYDRPTESGTDACIIQISRENSISDPAYQETLDTDIQKRKADSLGPEGRLAVAAGLEAVVEDQHSKVAPPSRKRKRKSVTHVPPSHRIDSNGPLIITFDSLGLAHQQTNKALKEYLAAEGKAKRAIELDTSRIKGITAKQIPQQKNYCDCGLFLLGYIAKFLEGPKDFITKVVGREYDVEKDWSTLIPSNLRANIRSQIQAFIFDQEDNGRDCGEKSDLHAGEPGQNHVEEYLFDTTTLDPKTLDEKPSDHESGTVANNPYKELRSIRKDPHQVDEYQGKPKRGHEECSLGVTTQLEMKPFDTTYISDETAKDAGNCAEEPRQTKKKALETALPISAVVACQASVVHTKQPEKNHMHQDSSDPLHEEAITVGDSPSPQFHEECSFVIPKGNASAVKLLNHVGQLSYPVTNTRQAIERPPVVQDSQPNSPIDPPGTETVHSKSFRPRRSNRLKPEVVEVVELD